MQTRTKQVDTVVCRPNINTRRHSLFDKMEAIACGVQARLEESTNFSKKVTDETVNTARALGVADSVIEKWASQRLNNIARETERLREIRALLDRIYRDRTNTAAS
jgi:ABC-type ATPase with predicted acetyltransferase domain